MAEVNSRFTLPDDVVHCSLCLELFTQPKALPCLHTFCLACLQQYVKSRRLDTHLPCPLCNKHTPIPGRDVNKFMNNFFIQNLIEDVHQPREELDLLNSGKKLPQFSSDSRCHVCESPGHVNNFCSSCDLWLCVDCSRNHKRVPLTYSHDLTSGVEINRKCKMEVEEKRELLREWRGKLEAKVLSLREQSVQSNDNHRTLECEIRSAADRLRSCVDRQERQLLEKLGHAKSKVSTRTEGLLKCVAELRDEIDNMEREIDAITNSTDGQTSHSLMTSLDRVVCTGEERLNKVVGERDMTRLTFEVSESSLAAMSELKIGHLNEGEHFACVQHAFSDS